MGNDLAREAHEVWVEYGRVICEAFRFPPGSLIAASPLQDVIRSADDARIQDFIDYVRQATEEWRNAKFIDEH